MAKTAILHAKQIVQVEQSPVQRVSGSMMNTLPCLDNGFVLIEKGKIIGVGSMDELPNIDGFETIDASGCLVFPTWCDSHTHLVYAGSREGEFVDRINGLTYEEIGKKGGGILNSAKRLQNASEDELFESALGRLSDVVSTGTGAIEIKSGYGLTLDAELKMLRVVKRLKEASEVAIRANFLGAHAFPQNFKEDREGYIQLIIEEMIPAIKSEGLADFIDAFCESNYFSPDEMDRILDAGVAAGLVPKVHVNQFTSIGGIEVAIKHGALSVDHLEVMQDSDIKALKSSTTIPTLLPSCSFFLGIPYGPAKELISEGLPIALATDFNPGSTPSGNMPFVLSLACIKMKLTPEQAINATTINGAAAMGLQNEVGSIATGKKANLFITKPVPSYAYIPYSFGSRLVDKVWLNGILQG